MDHLSWQINSEHSLQCFIKFITEEYNEKSVLTVTWQNGKKRTNRQNNALMLYCRLLAEALNSAGLDMKRTLKQEVDISWTQESVLEHLWRPIQKLTINKNSTTEAKTDEYSKVYDELNRHLSQKFGISVPFPSKEYHYDSRYIPKNR